MTRQACCAALIAVLAACGDSPPPPPPKPAAQPAPAPVAQPAPKPEVKPVAAPAAPAVDPNKELAARVKRALEDEGKIQAAGIDVSAADGRVTLWGTAATPADRVRAAQVAGKVDGVKSVENKLAVVKGS